MATLDSSEGSDHRVGGRRDRGVRRMWWQWRLDRDRPVHRSAVVTGGDRFRIGRRNGSEEHLHELERGPHPEAQVSRRARAFQRRPAGA
jgi:hypothetical protein